MAKRSRIDMSRLAQAALEAALTDEQQQPQHRSRLSGVRALAAGAALVAVTRVAVKKAPGLLPSTPRLSDLTDSVRDRLADHGWIEDEEPEAPEDYEDEPLDEAAEWDEESEEEEPADDDDEDDDEWGEDEDDDEADDDGPRGAEDEDWDDDEEPADEDDDDEDEEEPPPAIEIGSNGGSHETASTRAPDLLDALSPHHRPPVLRGGDQRVDPAERPPEPPKRRKRQRSQKTKGKAKTGKG